MRQKLSVTIITKNEERNIERCLKSVTWADEIIVLDTGSEDKTAAICKLYGAKVFESSDWEGFGLAKRKAVSYASNDWILSIDADEVITTELEQSINKILEDTPPYIAYRIKRMSFYLGKIINHCGWDNEYKKRLFNKQKANFNNKTVHETVVADKSKTGTINEVMLHYTYPTIESHFLKMHRYTTLSSINLSQEGKRSSSVYAVFRGMLQLFKMYFLQLGILDGKEGFILCINSSWSVYLKYIKLWELNR